MPFKGLFIGIDRYASPGIDWLSCARRDAAALDGLFTDTTQRGGVLSLAGADHLTFSSHFLNYFLGMPRVGRL